MTTVIEFWSMKSRPEPITTPEQRVWGLDILAADVAVYGDSCEYQPIITPQAQINDQ